MGVTFELYSVDKKWYKKHRRDLQELYDGLQDLESDPEYRAAFSGPACIDLDKTWEILAFVAFPPELRDDFFEEPSYESKLLKRNAHYRGARFAFFGEGNISKRQDIGVGLFHLQPKKAKLASDFLETLTPELLFKNAESCSDHPLLEDEIYCGQILEDSLEDPEETSELIEEDFWPTVLEMQKLYREASDKGRVVVLVQGY